MNIAILGAQMGDEGKGRIVHDFSSQYDWVIRFNGGANAGHTIYRDGKKYVHNLLPSVDFRKPYIKSFLGSGMVLDLAQLAKEIEDASVDFPEVGRRIFVDPEAFIVTPEHKEKDRLTNQHIGSTNRGIGPAYADKIGRCGVRVSAVMSKTSDDFNRLVKLGVQFKTALSLRNEFDRSSLLFEGAQGVLLDINHGTYPYVSCSDCTVSGIGASGFNWVKLEKVYGVAKAYATRVGEGPFPTEVHDEEADVLRKLGNEYGATTGRPRRVGWLDAYALGYACRKGGIDRLILTKFDILNGMKNVNVAVNYGDPYKYLGMESVDEMFNAKPMYANLSGWEDAKADVRDMLEARGAPKCYVGQLLHLVEDVTSVKTEYVSVGVNPQDLIRV